MAYGPNNRTASSPYASGRAIDQAQYDAGLRQHMLRVYNYMTGGLALTGGVAWLASNSPALMNAIYGSPLMWVVMLAPLAFVFALSFGIRRMSFGTAQMVFWAYAGLMGLSLSSIFLIYSGADITRVFFITAATFAGMSLYGYTTKRDLTGFGSFLFMGLLGLIVASIVNIFLGSGTLYFAISAIGVLIFVGLTAYDTQKIKELYDESWDGESLGKLAIMGALSLYLDFVNLFLMLLRLFGSSRE